MNGYDATDPGGGFLSGPAPAKPVKVLLRASQTAAPGWPGFFGWLATAHPDLYALMRVQFPNLALTTRYGSPSPMISGLGADTLSPIDVTAQTLPYVSTPAPSWSDQIVSALTSLAPTVIATVDQQKIFNAQLGRAQSGLPPLNTTSYGLPSMQGAVSTLIWPVVIVGGGLFLLMGRRRR